MTSVLEPRRVPRRRNLVILRAGDTSLHPRWLEAPAQDRNWDLIVSYFGDDPEIFRGEGWLRIDSKGPKMRGLHTLIGQHEALIREYEYVWFPEDDLDCTCGSINRLFDLCRQYALALAQPSLTQDSYFSYPITLHNPRFRLRYTTFVEIMAPCMTQAALWTLLPTLDENITGWGLDLVWPALLGPEAAVAVVDEVQIRHTRPVGGGNLYKLLPLGKTAWDERREVAEKYGVTQPCYRVRSGVRPSGRVVLDGPWLLYLYASGLLTAALRLPAGWGSFPRMWLSAIRQQLRGRPW